MEIDLISILYHYFKYISTFRRDDLGNEYLETNDIAYETNWDLWKNFLFQFIIASIAFTITYIRLKTINKYR